MVEISRPSIAAVIWAGILNLAIFFAGALICFFASVVFVALTTRRGYGSEFSSGEFVTILVATIVGGATASALARTYITRNVLGVPAGGKAPSLLAPAGLVALVPLIGVAAYPYWTAVMDNRAMDFLGHGSDRSAALALERYEKDASNPARVKWIMHLLNDGSLEDLKSLCLEERLASALEPFPAAKREEARSALIKRLGDSRPGVRLMAATCLGAQSGVPGTPPLGAAEAVDTALSILLDPAVERASRLRAMELLGSLRDVRAAEELWKIEATGEIGGGTAGDDEEGLRWAATQALDRIYGLSDVSRSGRPDAYPAVLRTEQAVLSDARAVMAAQFAFRTATGTFAGAVECLERPEVCGAGRTFFLGPHLASLVEKDGYLRQFLPGPTASKSSGASRWAYRLVPAPPQRRGLRAFCADDTARICFAPEGLVPEVRQGRCPESDREPGDGSGDDMRRPAKPCLPWGTR